MSVIISKSSESIISNHKNQANHSIVSKFKLSETTSPANDLLCGTGGVESEEAILNLLKLKEIVQANPELKTLFEKPDTAILSTLDSGYSPDFYNLLQEHLERYGDRTLLGLITPNIIFAKI